MKQKYKIVHIKDDCIGCGACVQANEKHWEIDTKEAIINLKNNKDNILILDSDYENNLEAANCCPVNCIHIYKIKEDLEEEKII